MCYKKKTPWVYRLSRVQALKQDRQSALSPVCTRTRAKQEMGRSGIYKTRQPFRKHSFQCFISLLSLRACRSMFSLMEDQSPGEQDSDPASRKEPVASIGFCMSSTILLPVLPSTALGSVTDAGRLEQGKRGSNHPWHPTTTDWTRQLMRKLWKIKGWIKSSKHRSSLDPFHRLTASSHLNFLPLHKHSCST